MPNISISNSLQSLSTRLIKAQIITPVVVPFLDQIADGDVIEDKLSADIGETTNYNSIEGTITSVTVTATVNGDPADLTDEVAFEDVVSVTVTVQDDASNERVFTLGRTVAGIAPTNDVAPSIAGGTGLGDTLTVTAGTWSGVPEPTLSGQWLRDGVAITGETGATYEVTSEDQGADITYLETATNAAGSDTAVSNVIAIPAATVPDAFGVADWDVVNDDETISVNILTLPSDGGTPITDLEYRVNEGAAISLGETTTGSYEITADEGDDIQIRAVNAIGAGDWSDVKVVPEAFTGVQASGGVETVIEQEGEFYRVHTFLESGDLTVTEGGEVEYLVVAGGGSGGGGGASVSGGGGGAGGLLQGTKELTKGIYDAIVGLGAPSANDSNTPGSQGQNSEFETLIAIGGGAGGALGDDGGNGGSGGGAGSRGISDGENGGLGTEGQGFDGGSRTIIDGDGASASGGGATSAGQDTPSTNIALGGSGLISDITGQSAEYAKGGDGNEKDGPLAADGQANTGKGGQGGPGGPSGNRAGSNGGSGIVIIRYPITETEYNAEVA